MEEECLDLLVQHWAGFKLEIGSPLLEVHASCVYEAGASSGIKPRRARSSRTTEIEQRMEQLPRKNQGKNFVFFVTSINLLTFY